jgi:predicted branched-subunit amino acid permease
VLYKYYGGLVFLNRLSIEKQKPFWETFWDVLYKYYWLLVFLNVWIYWKMKTLLGNSLGKTENFL